MSKKIESKDKVLKDATITIRLESEVESYIEQVATTISKKQERVCTKTWVVEQLIKAGMPHFEKKWGIKRAEKKPA